MRFALHIIALNILMSGKNNAGVDWMPLRGAAWQDLEAVFTKFISCLNILHGK